MNLKKKMFYTYFQIDNTKVLVILGIVQITQNTFCVILYWSILVVVQDGEDEEDDKPQLMIIEPLEDDYNVISTDYLCLKNHDKHSVHDLHLEYLLEDQYYFIVSPNDIFFGKPRDEDDHVEWLILQQEVKPFKWEIHLDLKFEILV